jgi:hypothetical protein
MIKFAHKKSILNRKQSKMKTILGMILLVMMVACKSKSENTMHNPIVQNPETTAEEEKSFKEFQAEEKKRLAQEIASMTSMTLDKTIHDYGKVKEGSENKTTFKVTNTGKNPLIISKVEASCGCTTPKKPEQPIAPGASDEIEVVFSPKPGQGPEIEKAVTITSNTSPVSTVVKIKATIVK